MTARIEATELPEVLRITSAVHHDSRGWFSEIWNVEAFGGQAGIPQQWAQFNAAWSEGDVVRGIHWQLPPAAQVKLVRPLQGRVIDVAVDLRQHSPTFGRWVAAELDAEAGDALLIPEGFGHGYRALGGTALLSYALSAPFAPQHERTLRWNDPTLAIDWGGDGTPKVSAKDAAAPLFTEADLFS